MNSSVMIGYRVEGEVNMAIIASREGWRWRISGEEFQENACWISLSEAIRQAYSRWEISGEQYRCTWMMDQYEMRMDMSEDFTFYADINGVFDRHGVSA